MKYLSLLPLALIIFSCETEDSRQYLTPRNIEVRVNHLVYETLDLGSRQNKSSELLDNKANDSILLENYSLSLNDEQETNRIVTDSLNLELQDSLEINSVFGDFEIFGYHQNQEVLDKSKPLSNYSLHAQSQGLTGDDSIELFFSNINYCYIWLDVQNREVLNVRINNTDLFNLPSGDYFAYLDTRHDTFIMEVELENETIVKTLSVSPDVKYRYYFSESGESYTLQISYGIGFENDFVSLDLLQAENLLKNGDFEQGWNNLNKPNSYEVYTGIEKDSILKKSGEYSARHLGGTSILSQDLTIEGDSNYLIGFDYYIEQGDGTDGRLWSSFLDANNLEVQEIRSTTSYLQNSEGNGNWNHFEGIYNAPVTAEVLRFELRTYSGSIIIWDNLEVLKIIP